MDQAVMLVDDSNTMLDVFSSMLQVNGVKNINRCSNGYMAAKRVITRPNNYHAIFLDLHMPGMDGMEFLRLIGHHQYKGAIVIASKLEERLIDLALNISRDHNLHLLGSVPKPINEMRLKEMTTRIEQFHRFSKLPKQLISREELILAIANNWVLPYFQPQVCLETRKIRGFECLCRLDIPGRGVIPPANFLPVAEQEGLSNKLILKLIDLALPQFARMQLNPAIGNEATLAINLSPEQLDHPGWPGWLLQRAAKHHLQPRQIVVEITESQALINLHQMETLSRLAISGFRLSLDDFGTGFTNLNQLKELPLHEIKIDRSFCTNVRHDRVATLIVESITRIANELGIEVIAEGVENPLDLETLRGLNIRYFQGFLYSKPKAAKEVTRWTKAWQSQA